MLITLDHGEVRKALLCAIEEKTQNIFDAQNNEDRCYFSVVSEGKDIEDIESVEFSVIIEQ